MAVRLSTGLVNALLSTDDFRTVMNGFVIDLYSSTQPTDANTAPTGTKLLTYSVNGAGTGGSWNPASGGTIQRNMSESLMGVTIAAGVAGWIRIRLLSDLGTTNTVDRRIDMSIGSTGSDIYLANTSILASQQYVFGLLTLTPNRG